jgi:hypothetical protein
LSKILACVMFTQILQCVCYTWYMNFLLHIQKVSPVRCKILLFLCSGENVTRTFSWRKWECLIICATANYLKSIDIITNNCIPRLNSLETFKASAQDSLTQARLHIAEYSPGLIFLLMLFLRIFNFNCHLT